MYSYKLAKRKEEALKKLKDSNIKIFMGDDDHDLSNMQSINDQMKRYKGKNNESSDMSNQHEEFQIDKNLAQRRDSIMNMSHGRSFLSSE